MLQNNDQQVSQSKIFGFSRLVFWILLLQIVMVLVAAWWVVSGFIAGEFQGDSLITGVFLLLMVFLAAGWALANAKGVLGYHQWSRGSILTFEIMVCAVGMGAIQGEFAQPIIAFSLLIPAITVIALLFSKAMSAGYAQARAAKSD